MDSCWLAMAEHIAAAIDSARITAKLQLMPLLCREPLSSYHLVFSPDSCTRSDELGPCPLRSVNLCTDPNSARVSARVGVAS